MDLEKWVREQVAVQLDDAFSVFIEGDGLLWTRIPYNDWEIEVCDNRSRAVRIAHMPCFAKRPVWRWWGTQFRNVRQICFECGTMIDAVTGDFLLKAWEFYTADGS